MIGNPRYGFFGIYLAINFVTQIVVPVVQVLSIVLLAALALLGRGQSLPTDVWQWVLYVGLPVSVGLLVLAVFLNRALADLRHAWTLPLWPLYSAAMSLVMLKAITLELRGAENRWNKLERTGTVSIGADHRTKPSE